MSRFEFIFDKSIVKDLYMDNIYEINVESSFSKLITLLNRHQFLLEEKERAYDKVLEECNFLKLENELLKRTIIDLQNNVSPWSDSSVKCKPKLDENLRHTEPFWVR